MTPYDLPQWQLTSIFSGLADEDYTQAKQDLETGLAELAALMDEQEIGSDSGAVLDSKGTSDTALLETLLTALNRLTDAAADIQAYVTGFTATNAFDDNAQAEASKLKRLRSQLAVLETRFTAYLGQLSSDLVDSSELARSHRFYLEKRRFFAQHLMSAEAEALASSLDRTGGSAWAKLHNDLTSRTTLYRELPGQAPKAYPLSELKNLQSSSSPELRKAAFEAELELLGQNDVAFAAALNSIKGQVNALCERRGWASALELSALSNNITLASLGAMQTACQEAFPDFRRYLRAKARFLGKDRLAWYDLSAPVSVGSPRQFSWDETKRFVVDTFRSYSDDLAAFAERVFESGWCDVPPRRGKRSGAFCMGVPGRKESRLLLNFGHTLDDVFTVAHELGHAYHNEQMYRASRSAKQRETPMLLAETASIFCETIIVNAMLQGASDEDKLAILEQDLLGTTQLVVDIHSRFLLEQAVFEGRKARDLSVAELNTAMLEAQAATYGDALAADARHPLMWAHKGHYYSSERSFYNYPYTFGYLFGLGIYQVYQAQPEGFHERYDTLLSSTGLDDAASLARGFGIDIEDVAFWRGSLSIARGRAEAFEALIDSLT